MASKNEIIEQYYDFAKTLHAAKLGLCAKEKYIEKNSLIQQLAFGMSATYFWLNTEKTFQESKIFFANPNKKIVFEVIFYKTIIFYL